MRNIDHVISGGTKGLTGSGRSHQIWNPSTGEVQAEVALGDAALLDHAVEIAKKVQPGWAATNPQRRARVMFAYKQLIEERRADGRGLRGMRAVAHIKRDARSDSKV